MKHIKKLLSSVGAALAAVTMIASYAAAAPAYSLFGEASTVSPGGGSDTAVQLISDSNPGFGGVDFDIPAGTTLADLSTLSTDYNVTDDDCVGGSPRFQINVDDGGVTKNIFAYIGPSPNFTDCPTGWQNSGDLLEAGMTLDTAQLAGGTFYDTYADALADFGSLTVTGVQLVTDSVWAFQDGEQTVLVDNVNIDGALFDFEPLVPESKDECKKGGWQDFGDMFKNQGDCVSFVATGGRNVGAGS